MEKRIPKNSNIIETLNLKLIEIQDKIYINQYVYSREDLLGKGFYGEVYKVKNNIDHQEYACKIFRRSTLNNTVFLNNKSIKIEEFITKELAAAKLLKNENLTKAHEIINDVKADCIYLIMELCEGEFCKFDSQSFKFDNQYFVSDWFGTMFFSKKCIDYTKLKKVFKQLVSGLHYLHNLDLAHCDLKPQNIMKKEGNAKIADFESLAWTDPQDHLKSTSDNGFGTPYFQAPESQFQSDKTHLDKAKLDIWALGITFFIYAYGFLPFELRIVGGAVFPLNFKIIWSKIDEEFYYTVEQRAFIESMLNYDPEKRLSVYELINHEYLRDELDTFNYCINSFVDYTEHNGRSTDYSYTFFRMYGLKADEMTTESMSEHKSELHESASAHNRKEKNNHTNIHKVSYKKNSLSLKSISARNNEYFSSINPLFMSKNYSNNSSNISYTHKFLKRSNKINTTSVDSNSYSYNLYSKLNMSSNEIQFKNQYKHQFKKNENQNSYYQNLNSTKLTDYSESDLNSYKKIYNSNSTKYNEEYHYSLYKSKIWTNQQDLFQMTFESIKHKHRVYQKNKIEGFEPRRISDSNILDVIELKNGLNIKDHILYECIKEIDRIVKFRIDQYVNL